MEIPLKSIGTIKSPYKQKFCTPRQAVLAPSATAIIQLEAWLPEGILTHLHEFSHIWIISYFHKKGLSRLNGKIKAPRLNGEKVGVFASRSPHRPNPLGLSLVKLEAIDEIEKRVYINGMDLIDGTPVLDIKPYIPPYDQVDHADYGWVEQRQDQHYKVQFSDEAKETLSTLIKKEEYETLLLETLRLDTRNHQDKKNSDSSEVFKSKIGLYDVHFIYKDKTVIIQKLEKLSLKN